MKIHITSHKRYQERVAKLVYPCFFCALSLFRFLYRHLRLEGIIYGIRRAKHRATIGSLGEYSDISPNVVIKNPAGLHIGCRSNIGFGSFVDAGGDIFIGDFVMISHMVSINSMTHPTSPPYHSVIKAPTRIFNHVWIGANSVIMQGIEIGEGAIIGAGLVVTRSVDPFTIVAGVPARVIRRVVREMETGK